MPRQTIHRRAFPTKRVALIVGVYLLIAVGFWFWHKFSPGGSFTRSAVLHKYVTGHVAELKQDIFGTIFEDARACTTLSDPSKLSLCTQKVSGEMARVISEEDLVGVNGWDWPHDLFFVKQTGNLTERLGWDGKLVDITEQLEHAPKPNVLNRTWSLLFNTHCNYFHAAPPEYDRDICEIAVPLPVSENTTGYMVRLDGNEEEYWLVFNLLWPIVYIPQLFAR